MPKFWVAASLLWLAGAGLRLTVLAVPPVITLIQHDLHLSGTEIGVLSGLPAILFAAAALPGSLLIARLGALETMVLGLLVAGAASGLRGAAPSAYALYAATAIMSAGVAVMQPSLPPLVREWLPQRLSLGTAIYTNGLLVAETIPVMLTIPLVLPLVGNSWRWSFVLWGIPLIAIAALAWPLAPRSRATAPLVPIEGKSWWPDWSDKLIWQIGVLFGSVNSVYFCCNAFLPGHLAAAGRADLIGKALTALNLGQLPASFALLAVASRLERRAWPFVVCGILMLLCVAGIASTANMMTILLSGTLGFLGAVVMTLGFGLPALLSAPAEVARMSAAMFTISYGEALVISVLSGAAWDLGGSPRFAFIPIAASAVPLLFLPATICYRRPPGA
jgi:CP family cyanate transporter-like MFS transporter